MHQWVYQSPDGTQLAKVSRPDDIHIGYPVRMVGPEPGPVREYVVVDVNMPSRTAVLERQ